MIQNRQGEIIEESDLEPTTTILTMLQFSEYLTQIAAWALTELGVYCGSNEEKIA